MSYQNERLALLLCIDSNCHSSSFGLDDNKRGDTLDYFIAAHNLKIENRGSEYTFETSTANSLIYITLSDELAVSVMNWSVEKGQNFTDHNNITFTLETEKVIIEKTRKWEDADWDFFTSTLKIKTFQLDH